jgi:hypothetical protein
VIEPKLSVDGIAVHLGVAKDMVHDWLPEKRMRTDDLGRLRKPELMSLQTSDSDNWVLSHDAAGNGLDWAKG